MSRKIDLSEPLSDEDRQYLLDRDRHMDITQNDALFGEGEVKEAARAKLGMDRINDGHTGDVDPFTADDGSDTVASLNPGSVGLTDAQRQRAIALGAGEADTDYDVEGQRELQESMVGGPPRVLGPDGSEVPQGEVNPVSTGDPNPERAGDTGIEGGADLRAEAVQNALATGDEEALEKSQELPKSQVSDNYDQLGKEQLREEAGRRDLPVSGTMPELKARLRAHDKKS